MPARTDQWLPGLPPVGTVCDVRTPFREMQSVRVEAYQGDGGGFLLFGGSRHGLPAIVHARGCEWRPIPVPAGVPADA